MPAYGGGSVSDCCKVISAQANVGEDLWELENTKRTFPTKFIPLGIIVTVFGTGSEMNSSAVITHEEKRSRVRSGAHRQIWHSLTPTIPFPFP